MVILIMMTLLLSKHYIADFLLQTPYQLLNKGKYGHLGGILHASIHWAGTTLVLLLFVEWFVAVFLGFADGIIHYHIDWIKSKINHRYHLMPNDRKFWYVLGADQLLHQLTYIGIIYVCIYIALYYAI